MKKLLRWFPFLTVSIASLWAAGHAPAGRRAPQFDWSFDPDALLLALTKVKHIGAMALIFVLAVLALGPKRSALAAAVTFVVGALWEVLQTTVVGHNARLADLVPNAAGILLAWALVVAGLYVLRAAGAAKV